LQACFGGLVVCQFSSNLHALKDLTMMFSAATVRIIVILHASVRHQMQRPPCPPFCCTSALLALQGQRLSSTEIQVLLRVLEQAELVPDTEEMGLDETLKRRTRALRAQKNTARAARSGRGRRASTLGFAVTAKDRAYEQNVRRLRVPKAASKARGEQAKQQLRAWRQQQAARQQQRLARQAVQLARLQLSANLAAPAGQTGVSAGSSSSSQSGGNAGVSAAAVDKAFAADAVAAAAPAAAGGPSASGWKSALAKMKQVLSQAVADPQQQQQRQQSSSPAAAGGTYQQQVAAAAVAQQLQTVASSARGAAAADGGGGQRIVIALVPLEQLPYVEQEWDRLAASQL
jgi:hypothetical protein